jgi:hypothetical protein
MPTIDAIAAFAAGAFSYCIIEAVIHTGGNWLDRALYGAEPAVEMDREDFIDLLTGGIDYGNRLPFDANFNEAANDYLDDLIQHGELPPCLAKPAQPTETAHD